MTWVQILAIDLAKRSFRSVQQIGVVRLYSTAVYPGPSCRSFSAASWPASWRWKPVPRATSGACRPANSSIALSVSVLLEEVDGITGDVIIELPTVDLSDETCFHRLRVD